jgi:hypothetical protein
MSVDRGPRGLISLALSVEAPFPVVALSVCGGLVVVLFDPDAGLSRPGQFENLRAYDSEGAEVWRASLPTSTSSDCFVSLTGGGSLTVGASSFSGYRLTLEAATGAMVESEFTK